MSRWVHRLLRHLSGDGGLPEDFSGQLEAGEHLLAVSRTPGGGHIVATSRGLWLSEGEHTRRLGWHLVSKVTWDGSALTITEAEEVGAAGSAVMVNDLPPRRYPLVDPGRLPNVVQTRVTGSIRSSHRQDLPGGSASFVQRRVPGRDGVVLQARVEQDADPVVVADIAAEVARRIDHARMTEE